MPALVEESVRSIYVGARQQTQLGQNFCRGSGSGTGTQLIRSISLTSEVKIEKRP